MVTKRALLALTDFGRDASQPRALVDQAIVVQLVEALEAAARRDTAAGVPQQWYTFEPRSAGLPHVYGVVTSWRSNHPIPLPTAVLVVLMLLKPSLLQYVLDDLLFYGRVRALPQADEEDVDLAAVCTDHIREERREG
jgi:hypothetical protein